MGCTCTCGPNYEAREGDTSSDLTRCTTYKEYLNKECFPAISTTLGVPTAKINTLHTALTSLHTACQAAATDEVSHAACDGSDFTVVLTDTAVTAKLMTDAGSTSATESRCCYGCRNCSGFRCDACSHEDDNIMYRCIMPV